MKARSQPTASHRSAKLQAPSADHLAARAVLAATLTPEQVSEAVARGVRSVMPPVESRNETESRAYGDAFDRYLRGGEPGAVLARGEHRDMGEGGSSGYLVPAAFNREVLTAMKAGSAIVGHAKLFQTPTSSAPLKYPTLTDTSTDAQATAENTQFTETDITFGTLTYGQCPAFGTPNLARVGRALLQDSAFDIQQILTDAFSFRVQRAVEKVAVATLIAGLSATNSASAGVIKWADLLSMYYAVDAAYRPGSVFVFSTAAMKAIRALVDTTNARPLLLDTPVINETDGVGNDWSAPLLLGSRVYESNYFDTTVATGKNVGFFGNLSHCLPIRQGPQPIITAKTEARAEFGEIEYVGMSWWDASVIGLAAAGTYLAIS
jgi:HK97 family phage major capsid protein